LGGDNFSALIYAAVKAQKKIRMYKRATQQCFMLILQFGSKEFHQVFIMHGKQKPVL